MDYVSYFIKQNRNKSEEELIDIYLETIEMDKPEEVYLVNLIKTGLYYVSSMSKHNKLKVIMEKYDG